MAVTATFSPPTLSIFGDSLDNNIATTRNAAPGPSLSTAGRSLSWAVRLPSQTRRLIEAFRARRQRYNLAQRGEWRPARCRQTCSAAPATTAVDRRLRQRSACSGKRDNDTLLGKGGNDFLFGGEGNDTLTGGDGDDQMFGEAGNDRMIWNPGDDTDLIEGGAGHRHRGSQRRQRCGGLHGHRQRHAGALRSDQSGAVQPRHRHHREPRRQHERRRRHVLSATGNLAALIGVTVDGGAGNDTILGSNGADILLGGDGNDFIDGHQGNDTAFLGAGDDAFQWDPGDGSDMVEGQAGTDTLLFNGSGGNEIFNISANGGRVLFTRNLGNIVMDLNDIETITLNALGGTDTITVNDLSGTDVTAVNVNLAGTIGGSAGDGAVDTVIVNGTTGSDAMVMTLQAGNVVVNRGGYQVVVREFRADRFRWPVWFGRRRYTDARRDERCLAAGEPARRRR